MTIYHTYKHISQFFFYYFFRFYNLFDRDVLAPPENIIVMYFDINART